MNTQRSYRGARHCDLRSEAEQEAISIYLPINELLNEIASSAFGPPRKDATTLIICDVAYGASALPVITYILHAARLGLATTCSAASSFNVEEMMAWYESCKGSTENRKWLKANS